MNSQYKNVLQYIAEAEAALNRGLTDHPASYPLFLRRNSWEHPRTAFLVLDTFPEPRVWVELKPPYFGGPNNAKVQVYGVAFWGMKNRYSLEWLLCPGTYSYQRIERPDWWDPPDLRASLDVRHCGSRQRWPGDFLIDCSLRAGEPDRDEESEIEAAFKCVTVPGITGRA